MQTPSKFGNTPVRYYPNSAATFNLLLSGDIERNPGPTKDPCGKCSKSVRTNQRSLLCEVCLNYWHQKCIPDMSITHYSQLINSSIDWFCPPCTATCLPFSTCCDALFHELFSQRATAPVTTDPLPPTCHSAIHLKTPSPACYSMLVAFAISNRIFKHFCIFISLTLYLSRRLGCQQTV